MQPAGRGVHVPLSPVTLASVRITLHLHSLLLLSLRLIKNDNELGKGQYVPFSVLLALSLSLSLSLTSTPQPFLSLASSCIERTQDKLSKRPFSSMKWRLKSILIPCLQNQAYIIVVSVICLFLLKYMHALSVKEKCSGCNSPWTSIILDFPTGWSSMQRGHFQCTKTKIIMTIKQTCGLHTPACSERNFFTRITIVWIQIPNHYSEQFTKWWCKKAIALHLESCQA